MGLSFANKELALSVSVKA